MAASILNALSSPVIGSYPTGFSVSAGDNRWLYIITFDNNGSGTAARPTGGTYGGQTLTRIGTGTVTTNVGATVTVWALNEAGLDAASGTTASFTGGATFKAGYWYSIQDADQTGPHVFNEASLTAQSSGSLSLAREDGGHTGHALAHLSAGGISGSANPTFLDTELDVDWTVSVGYEASDAETVAATWSSGFSVDIGSIVWNIGPFVGGGGGGAIPAAMHHRRMLGMS